MSATIPPSGAASDGLASEPLPGMVGGLRKRLGWQRDPGAHTPSDVGKAAWLFLATKLVYGPLNRNGSSLGKYLFYNDYLSALSKFGWREQHTIVFDHLVAPTAFYISRAEFETWWRDIGAKDVKISWHNKNSWCGLGVVE